jgi:uncharacterized Tic20 family protein
MSNTAEPSSDFVDRPWMEGEPEPQARAASDPLRTWLVACHLAPVVLWFFFPYGCALVVPLLIWQLKAKQEDDPRLVAHSVEALNFQINLTLLTIALSITIIGLAVVPIVMIAGLVFPAIASVKTYKGKQYRYPWIHRFIEG